MMQNEVCDMFDVSLTDFESQQCSFSLNKCHISIGASNVKLLTHNLPPPILPFFLILNS